MVRELEYDVTEMAFTTYLAARAHGKPFTALPVFLVRGFHHGAILRQRGRRIDARRTWRARRVGVNRGYTVTTGVWARGILSDEYGVDLSRVTWVLSGDEHVAEYVPPSNVVPAAAGQDVADDGRRGRTRRPAIGIPAGRPGMAPLIPDAARGRATARCASAASTPSTTSSSSATNCSPQHPGLAASLFEAYAEAKRRYVAALADGAITDPGAGRPHVPAGRGDHRRGPAAVRDRPQPGHDRPAHPVRRRPEDPRQARHGEDIFVADAERPDLAGHPA